MDPVDQIIVANSPASARHILILDAPALVAQALSRADRVSVWCDDIRDAEQVPPELLIDQLAAPTLAGVDLVWLRLPQALGALDEYAGLVAAYASDHVRLIGAAREKHLNRTMNVTLARHFGAVAASLGQRKSRALMASGRQKVDSESSAGATEAADRTDPLTRPNTQGSPGRDSPADTAWPRHRTVLLGGHQIELHWHGATFAAGRVDAGTQLLIDHLGHVADAASYLDFGSGSGILATLLALDHPDASVDAVDASRAAVGATQRTAATTQVRTHWGCNLAGWPADSFDVIVCNPPFHRGTAKDSDPTFRIFEEAARTLVVGGEFWCVYNSHLPWRRHLDRLIGPTRLIAQNRHYSLSCSERRAAHQSTGVWQG